MKNLLYYAVLFLAITLWTSNTAFGQKKKWGSKVTTFLKKELLDEEDMEEVIADAGSSKTNSNDSPDTDGRMDARGIVKGAWTTLSKKRENTSSSDTSTSKKTNNPTQSPTQKPSTSRHQKRPSYSKQALGNSDVQYSNGLRGFEMLELVSCIGSRGDQTVKLIFKIKHELVNQSVNCDYTKSAIYTDAGVQLSNYKVFVGNEYLNSKYSKNIIHYDVGVQCGAYIRNVLPTCQNLQKVALRFGSRNADGADDFRSGEITFVDVPITWE